MRYIADLHIHSPYSRATSKSSHLHGLAAWAALKGIDVVGTGDFTHPGWLRHLVENLAEAEPGFFRLKDTRPELFSDIIPPGLEPPDISRIRFVLTSEISSIYKRGGRVRKVHNILFAHDLDSVRRINATLSGIGNLESDGRPILGLDSRDLLEIQLEKAPEGFLVPAHIWTPWFSLFGSKSGFDTIEDCFGDLSGHIFALETGLSSDPDMNRTISALDRFSLISNSDCHSPAKLGREANIFTTGFDFFSLRDGLRSPARGEGGQRFAATVEFYPEEGKYHCDGHRKCGVCMEPDETREHGGICPECGRPLTVGVLYRVMELADRKSPVYPPGSPAVHSLVPLPELLGELLQVGPASKKVTEAYVRLVNHFGSEFSILLDTAISDLEDGASALLAEAVNRVRTGRVIRQPGYDGEFGVIRVFTDNERKGFGGQMNLFGSSGSGPQAGKKRNRGAPPITEIKRKKNPAKKKELNPEQQRIVKSGARHILVKAGPGTGKTHTLLQRLVRVVSGNGQFCTVITFTNKAARELQDRLHKLIGDHESVHVATFHGYCLKWLRRYRPELHVAGPELRRWFLRSLCENGEKKRVDELDVEITSFLQNGPDLNRSVPDHLTPYFRLLESESLVDIDAVVPALATMLREENTAAEAVRGGTGTLFIDEFQDLNRSQYELVRLLAATSAVFAIGDPDQAIYGFRGSSPAWFYRFVDDLSPARFTLYRNYRNCPEVVKAANMLIANNPHPGPVEPNVSSAEAPGDIFFFEAGSPRGEAEMIVQQIEMLLGGTSHREIDRLQQFPGEINVTLKDIAVLYRTTRQAAVIAGVLAEHGLPVQVVDVRPFYLGNPVRILYFWTLMAAGLADSAHLVLVLKQEKSLGPGYLQEIEKLLPRSGAVSLAELEGMAGILSEPVRAKVSELRAVKTKVVQTAEEDSVIGALHLLARRYELAIDSMDFLRLEQMAENFGTSLDAFAQHLLLHNDSVVYDERAEAVTLMTLHASKGLEFKVVFIVGLEEGMLPLSLRRDVSPEMEAEHIAEERRIFYVGLTRAGEILYLSHVRDRRVEGRESIQEPSRFLREISSAIIKRVEIKAKRKFPGKKIRQLNLFE